MVITGACRSTSSSNRRTSTRAVTVATALTTFLSHSGLSESNCSVALRASGSFAFALVALALALLATLALGLVAFAGDPNSYGGSGNASVNP